jgi:hypothetical protein
MCSTPTSTYKTDYTDAFKMQYTMPVYTTGFLKMNPWVQNMMKTSKKLKIKRLIEKRCILLVYILQLYYNAQCKKHKIVSNIACSNT